jgi:anthranilate/para-aminobenzoate synthase component I
MKLRINKEITEINKFSYLFGTLKHLNPSNFMYYFHADFFINSLSTHSVLPET